MPLITHAFTQIFLHGDTFAQREMPLYTQILLQRDDLTLISLTQTPKQKKVLLQRNACARRVFSYGHFHTDILLNYFLWRTRVWRKEFSKHMQNHSLTTAFDGRDAFSVKRVGLEQTHIAIWPQCMTIDISCERVAFRGRQSTSHLHIPTSRFQKNDFRLHLNIFRTTPAYGIYSFGSCVKEDSVNLRLWICT